MFALFSYLLKVVICSALFAGCYWCILRNGRFYQWNRFYIVTAVVLSIVIPLLDIPMTASRMILSAPSGYVAHIVVDPAEVTATATTVSPNFSWRWLLLGAYILVVLLFVVKETISLICILSLKHKSERIHTPETNLYCIDDDTAPFTFFRTIFWKRGFPVDSNEGRCMLRHELAHVRLGHSWDKALMQLACCVFWMNPFFMLLRRELELVHEFTADSESIDNGNVEELSSLILCTLYPNHYHDFTSRFFQSSVKRRIFMITKNKKSTMGLLRKLSIVPVILITLYAFSVRSVVPSPVETGISQPVWQDPWTPQNDIERFVYVIGYGSQDKKVTPKEDIKVIRDSERKIASGAVSYNDVEQKPVFQGADNDFRSYLAKNMNYPANAQENGIVGTVVVSFVVDKNGKVTDVKSPVKIEYLSDELERVIKASPAWKPGRQGGKDVAVQCYSFVEFKLAGEESSGKVAAKTFAKNESKNKDDVVYTIVEDMPLFNGKSAEEGFREYVMKNTVYPIEAQEKGISGRVMVQFTIDENGNLTDAEIARGVDPLLDNEALRVIKSSPQWNPGYQKGKAVPVRFTYPVGFKLNDGPGSKSTSSSVTQVDYNNEVFTIVETMPLFDGKSAEEGFREYVMKNTVYPAEAQEKGISGRVMVEFIIDKEGNLKDVKIARGVDPLLDNEALRVIRTSPTWTPGKQRGINVAVKYTFPVGFSLNN